MKRSIYIILVISIILLGLDSCRYKPSFVVAPYKLDYNPNHEIHLVVSQTPYDIIIIPGHILFYGFNNEYIFAAQKPTDSIVSVGLSNPEREEIVFNTRFSNYWLIDIKKDSVHGPLKKKEYLSLRRKLGIPDTFRMEYSTLDWFRPGQRSDIEYRSPDSDLINFHGENYEN